MIKDHSLIAVGYEPIFFNVIPLELTYDNNQTWMVRGVGYTDPIALLSTQEALDLINVNNAEEEAL